MSSSTQLAQLESSLLSASTPLDARFRALFELRGLATSGSEQDAHTVIDIIARGFTDDSALLKHELAYVLGQIANPHANAYLESVLKNKSEDPMVRHEAAEALGAISSIESLPVLQEYINDADVSVRETCELAIEKIKYDQSDEAKAARAARQVASEARASGATTTSDESNAATGGDQDEDEAFAPIDPAPSFASAALGPPSSSQSRKDGPAANAEAAAQSVQSLSSDPSRTQELLSSYRTALLDSSLSLWHRYRAMFSLRNVVHAAGRASERCRRTAVTSTDTNVRQQQSELASKWDGIGNDAVLALADGLQDRSALFRHEICFVFGELSHQASIPSMLRVLADPAEHEMVRHEAAEALGGIAEEAAESASQQEGQPASSSIADVVKELKRWAEDLTAPRVVRESCIVALDEMAYNNDPKQFQRIEASAN